MKNLLLILLGGVVGYKIADSMNQKTKHSPAEIQGGSAPIVANESKLTLAIKAYIDQYVFGSDRAKMKDLILSMPNWEQKDIYNYFDKYYFSYKKDIPADLIERLNAINSKYNFYYFKEAKNLH